MDNPQEIKREKVRVVPIKYIDDFPDHPFKVVDDESMEQLIRSIDLNGVLTPVIARKKEDERYELISGHRRKHACEVLGLELIPIIVRDMSRDEATIEMVDSNLQREHILPSEKAWAYKMKMDAMKHQGSRQTSGQNGPKLSVDMISEQSGDSSRQIKRYIRLTELIPEILDLVDKKRLQFTCAVDISYFDKTIQKWLNEYIRENVVIKPIQIATLRERAEKENIDQEKMIMILHNALPGRIPAKKVVMNEKKLRRYFPEGYTSGQMERVIEALLEQWSKEQKGAEDGI